MDKPFWKQLEENFYLFIEGYRFNTPTIAWQKIHSYTPVELKYG